MNHVFDIEVTNDPAVPQRKYEKPLRYGKRDEINHIFRPDATSGPKIISVFFVLAILATVPVLLGAVCPLSPACVLGCEQSANISAQWAFLGANLTHLTDALSAAPISHGLFFGSIVSIEGIFYLYYSSWNLFQTLPVAGAVGLVAFLSGSKALSEVQTRRIAGKR